MKRFISGILSVLCLTGALALGASKPKEAPDNASVEQQKMLWDYQTQLGLSDQQVTDLKQYVGDFQTVMTKDRAKLQVVEMDLQELLQKNGDLEAVKAKVNESASIQADMRIADIETARKINQALTADQLKKWQAIQLQLRNSRRASKPKSTPRT